MPYIKVTVVMVSESLVLMNMLWFYLCLICGPSNNVFM